MKISRYLKLLAPVLCIAVAASLLLGAKPADAAVINNADLIDPSVFLNAGTMSQASIQTFLAGEGGYIGNASNTFPNTDLAGDPQWTAAQIIYYASQYVGINPQVILATLQQQESLVTDPSPDAAQLNNAMGYGCPDSGSCANDGFYYNVVSGAWQLRLNYERANGNSGSWTSPNGTVWQGAAYACPSATEFYSPGLYPGTNVTFYDGNGTAYTSFVIANASTASLYCYTPHAYNNPSGLYGNPQYGTTGEYYSGGYNFDASFDLWFGTTSATPYAAQFYNQSTSPVLAPGGTASAYLEYENTGALPWYDNSSIGGAPAGSYPVHLATADPINRSSVFAGGNWQPDNNRPDLTFSAVYDSDGVTLATNQHVVQPGQIVKFAFTFTVAAGQAPGTYQENFQPVAEGTPTGAFADPGTYLDVTVTPVYTSAYAAEGTSPQLLPGQSAQTFISYQNAGNATWYDDDSIGSAPAGTLPVHLATSHALNRSSIFGSTWGSGQDRPATTFSAVYNSDGVTLASNQHVVQPGQIAKFAFTLTAPTQLSPASYTEYFQPVVEGGTTMNDPNTYLNPSIISGAVGADTDGTQSVSLTPGATTSLTLHFTNVGNVTWTNTTTNLLADQGSSAPTFKTSSWVSSSVVSPLNQSSVAPGAAGTFNVTLQAPGTPGSYYLDFAPSNNATYFGDPVAAINVTVLPPTYIAQFYNQSASPVVTPGSTASGWLEYTNAGNVPWYDDSSIGSAPAGTFPVHLGTADPINRSSVFGGSNWQPDNNRPDLTFSAVYDSDGTTLAVNQHVVQPGQIVKFAFTFTIQSSQAPGTYQENFQPVAEGTPTGAFADPGTYLDVTVQPPTYAARYYNQSASPVLAPGNTAPGWLEYTNTGNIPWYDNSSIGGAPAGSYPVHLATADPINRSSVFAGGNWQPDNNRPDLTFSAVYDSDGVTLATNQHVVQPGQIVKFAFTFTVAAGQAPGTYQENFQPVAEGTPTGAFADPGTYLDVTIP